MSNVLRLSLPFSPSVLLRGPQTLPWVRHLLLSGRRQGACIGREWRKRNVFFCLDTSLFSICIMTWILNAWMKHSVFLCLKTNLFPICIMNWILNAWMKLNLCSSVLSCSAVLLFVLDFLWMLEKMKTWRPDWVHWIDSSFSSSPAQPLLMKCDVRLPLSSLNSLVPSPWLAHPSLLTGVAIYSVQVYKSTHYSDLRHN